MNKTGDKKIIATINIKRKHEFMNLVQHIQKNNLIFVIIKTSNLLWDRVFNRQLIDYTTSEANISIFSRNTPHNNIQRIFRGLFMHLPYVHFLILTNEGEAEFQKLKEKKIKLTNLEADLEGYTVGYLEPLDGDVMFTGGDRTKEFLMELNKKSSFKIEWNSEQVGSMITYNGIAITPEHLKKIIKHGTFYKADVTHNEERNETNIIFHLQAKNQHMKILGLVDIRSKKTKSLVTVNVRIKGYDRFLLKEDKEHSKRSKEEVIIGGIIKKEDCVIISSYCEHEDGYTLTFYGRQIEIDLIEIKEKGDKKSR